MLRYSREELRGMHFADFTHPHDIRTDLHLFEAVMNGERASYQLEKRYLDSDGKTVDVLLSATLVREEDGTPIQFISEIVDLTERNRVGIELEQANAQLRRQVITDHLTGVYNRRGFEEALLASRADEVASVLLIDLDNFKEVNDELGHRAGDIVLTEVGRRLPGLVRPGDFVARVGGDEFGIILYGADSGLTEEAAARVVAELGSVFEVDGAFANIGASVGASCSGPDGASLSQLVARADTALYAAKRAGRGTWRLAA
jgi:diguanylate cyclase (GGDEF)-like protein/PAS domain S-box-containing protein